MTGTPTDTVNEVGTRKYVVWKCTHSHKPHNPNFEQPCQQWNITKTSHYNKTKGKGFPVWCKFYTHDNGRRRRLSMGDFWVFETKEEAESFAYRKGQEDLQNMIQEYNENPDHDDAQEWF